MQGLNKWLTTLHIGKVMFIWLNQIKKQISELSGMLVSVSNSNYGTLLGT